MSTQQPATSPAARAALFHANRGIAVRYAASHAPRAGLPPDGPDGADLRQAAEWGLWLAAGSYDPARGPFAAWAVLVIRREVVQQVRRTVPGGDARSPGRGLPAFDPLPPGGVPDPRPPAPPPGTAADVGDVLRCLRGDLRLLIQLRFGQCMTHEEIGRAIGLSAPTICQMEKAAVATVRANVPGAFPGYAGQYVSRYRVGRKGAA